MSSQSTGTVTVVCCSGSSQAELRSARLRLRPFATTGMDPIQCRPLQSSPQLRWERIEQGGSRCRHCARLPSRCALALEARSGPLPPQPIKNQHVTDDEVHRVWERAQLPLVEIPQAPKPPSERDQLLHDDVQHPISTITQRYERLGWNAKPATRSRTASSAKGYASFTPVTTPTGQVKILGLTEQAREHFECAGITLQRSRHGGHRAAYSCCSSPAHGSPAEFKRGSMPNRAAAENIRRLHAEVM